MIKFLAGVVTGIAIATVGLTGIATMVDRGVDQTKSAIQQQVK